MNMYTLLITSSDYLVSRYNKHKDSTFQQQAVSCGTRPQALSARSVVLAYDAGKNENRVRQQGQEEIDKEGLYLVLHAELSFALGRTAELVGITKHIVQSNFSNSGEFVITDFTINNGATASVQSPNDLTYIKWKNRLECFTGAAENVGGKNS